LFEIIYWLFGRTWHIWVPIALFFLTIYLAKRPWKRHSICIYKFSSMFMQLIGVTFLLFLLNENILAIKNKTFINEISRWAAENPFNKKDAIIKLEGLSGKIGFSGMSARIKKIGKTPEERISILEEELEALREELKRENNNLRKTINEYKVETDSKISEMNNSYGKLNELVERVVVGDYRFPVFSSLMIFWGLIFLYSRLDGKAQNRLAPGGLAEPGGFQQSGFNFVWLSYMSRDAS